MLTELQQKKQQRFFGLLDSNRDGFVERKDFEAVAENLCIIQGIEMDTASYGRMEEVSEKLWIDIREYIDTSRDDRCSAEEWIKFTDEQIVNCDEAWYDNYFDSVVTGLFSLFDANGDGLISDMEYMQIFISFRIEPRHAATCFRRLDLNNDGYLNRDDLSNAVKEFFRSDDPKVDGNWLFGNWE